MVKKNKWGGYSFGAIVTVICVLSLLFSVFLGKTSELSSAAVSGAAEAVGLVLKLAGGLCFWSGIMKVAQKAGICDLISKMLSPFIKLVFPKINLKSRAASLISMNISANLLGLGNAATPFGIAAMRELNALNGNRHIASDDMVCFAVINSASVQFLPTTLAILRSSYGSENPLDILPAVVCASILSLAAALAIAKILPIICRKKKL